MNVGFEFSSRDGYNCYDDHRNVCDFMDADCYVGKYFYSVIEIDSIHKC